MFNTNITRRQDSPIGSRGQKLTGQSGGKKSGGGGFWDVLGR